MNANDMFKFNDITGIVIKCHDQDILIPVSECEVSVIHEYMEHYSSTSGLVRKDMRIVTGNAQGTIKFSPNGDVQVMERGDKESISDLLDKILKQQDDK